MTTTDDELLASLGDALRPDPNAAPPAASIAALHRAITTAASLPNPTSERRHRLLVGVTIVLAGSGLSGAAFAASGASLPAPIRNIAHAVGLPVDSSALADARADRNALRAALAHEDSTAIGAAAARLRRDIAQLEPGERAQLEPEVSALLGAAAARTDTATDHDETGPESDEPPPTTTASTSGDRGTDHGATSAQSSSATDGPSSDGDQLTSSSNDTVDQHSAELSRTDDRGPSGS